MTMFILYDGAGIGSDDLDSLQAFVDLVVIANDVGIGLEDVGGGMERVVYTRTEGGAPQVRLDELVNTPWTPDYGSGPANVDVIVVPALANFVLADGTTKFANNGTALPPSGSGLPGATLNPTANCLVIYDTTQNICVARQGTGGTTDLRMSNGALLYHEFSHAYRILRLELQALSGQCDPASPEEAAAINDENVLRTQIAERQGETPVLRDPGIHCGGACPAGGDTSCCIIASLVSGSPKSPQVQLLRDVRDRFVRSTEVGHAFFERLFYDYYAFSPQVCTMIAADPALGRVILEGYVEPLIAFWKLMVARAFEDLNDEELGRRFCDGRGAEATEAMLCALERTAAYWQYDDGTKRGAAGPLLDLLRERAWPSPHVQWTLVDPVRIYRDALAAIVDGQTDRSVGELLRQQIDRWVAEFPLDHVWGALARAEVERELGTWETRLVQSSDGRCRLRRRLSERFPTVTAVGDALDESDSRVCT
jgi:hypothetical protein